MRVISATRRDLIWAYGKGIFEEQFRYRASARCLNMQKEDFSTRFNSLFFAFVKDA